MKAVPASAHACRPNVRWVGLCICKDACHKLHAWKESCDTISGMYSPTQSQRRAIGHVAALPTASTAACPSH